MAITRWDPFRQIERWDPFREMSQLQQDMNRLLDRMVGDRGMEVAGTFIPPAEIQDNPDEIQLRIEVPGMEAKDIDVNVSADEVSISGERRYEAEEEKRGMKRSEFRYGRFQRVIPLPTRIQNDKVQAEFKNGVLHLNMPKAEEEKTRVVKVHLDGGQTSQG